MLGNPQYQRINLAELLEVRSVGLTASEVLTLLAASCDHLARASNRRGLFTAEQIFLTSEGKIEVQLIQITEVPKQLIPPELIDQSQPFGQGNSDSHLVWCLGNSFTQISMTDHSDVALFSLLNLMTVSHVQSRPSLQKVRQMIRNRLDVVEVDRMPKIIAGLFQEVMGDLDELIDDPFCDDIRFHSNRSSHLSIIPGPGAPEHRETRNLEEYQKELATEVADRLRRDFSLSRKHSQKNGADGIEHFEEALDIPDKIRPIRKKPIPSPRRGLSPTTKNEEEEGELTPRGGTPINEIAEEEFMPIQPSQMEWKGQKAIEEEYGKNNPFIEEQEEMERQRPINQRTNELMIRPNMESIQVEVHSPSPLPSPSIQQKQHPSSQPAEAIASSSSSHPQQSSSSPPSQPKSARLYAKANHSTAGNKVARVPKRGPEIEILPIEPEDESMGSLDEEERVNEDIKDSSNTQVTGYSPGTRRKQQQNVGMGTTKFQESGDDSDQIGGGQQQFHRHNSLQPGRCSRRASSGGRAAAVGGRRNYPKLPVVPEFLSNTLRPNIRLKAQSLKRKKMVLNLHRIESALVVVHLLDGHSVEVYCKTDQLVGAIFHTVAEHLNITEHIFFGLVVQQSSGEYIFLEEEQRLEKWAPPGWKNGSTGVRRSFGAGGSLPRSPLPLSPNSNEQFVLNLRFRYYPKKREFVKTAITAHQLYLQLRQDVLNGALRFQPREKAVEMAALALCVECGRPPAVGGDYFKLENYLPSKFYDFEPGEIVQMHREIGETHSKLAEHFGNVEAEERFIQMCQSDPYYGAHFYQVHKMKPKRGQQPFFANLRLVAVMPSGIGICREERGGTRRLFTSLHEWHQIRTLQFDRKRFLLGTVENGIAVDHVFYTDLHSKSAYLVRFAASQHRFMLKMRQWQGTLNRMKAMQRHRDVGVEIGGNPAVENHQQQSGGGVEGHRRNGGSQPQMGIGQQQRQRNGSGNEGRGGKEDGQNQQIGDRRQSRLLAETDTEYIKYCYGPDAQRVEVVLEKDPKYGLGLTLVDGAVNGVKGVYVKSVGADGDGRRKGLLIGDCLLSVAGVSLFNRTRHDAVKLVQDCGQQVRLEILRFPSISEVLAQEPLQNVIMNNKINGKVAVESTNSQLKCNENNKIMDEKPPPPHPISARRRTSSSFLEDSIKTEKPTTMDDSSEMAKRKESTMTNQSRTSKESGGGVSTPQSANSNRRQRAVSDFGGSFLPALRTDDILAAAVVTPKGRKDEEHRAQRYRRHKTSAGLLERTSDSEEEENSNSDDDDDELSSTPGTAKNEGRNLRGEYLPTKHQNQQFSDNFLPPVSAMYATLEDEEENDDGEEEEERNGRRRRPSGNNRQKQQMNKSINPLDGNSSSSPFVNNSSLARSPFAAAVERYGRNNTENLTMHWSNGNGGGNRESGNLDWTNELSDHFAAESPSPLQHPIAASSPYNNKPSTGMAEKNVEGANGEKILSIILDKSGTSPIGLSLAKRMGHDGVFIRAISPGTLIAQEGTLRVGDRIWRIQDEEVGQEESPASVVKKLKEIEGQLRIEVKRKTINDS